tara:strand:+ start:57 stop:479 length:423 start_codon:yes stop_codon:yes gene_type:complete
MEKRKLNRSRHDEVVKVTIWANELHNHYTLHPASLEEVAARYNATIPERLRKEGGEISLTTFKTVFRQLGIPFKRGRNGKYRRSKMPRVERLAREVRELSNKLDEVIKLQGLTAVLPIGPSEGIEALCRRHRDPNEESEV